MRTCCRHYVAGVQNRVEIRLMSRLLHRCKRRMSVMGYSAWNCIVGTNAADT